MLSGNAQRAEKRWGAAIDVVAPRLPDAEAAALSLKTAAEYAGLAPRDARAAKAHKVEGQLVVAALPSAEAQRDATTLSRALQVRREQPDAAVEVKKHLPWKLIRVIAGHLGEPLCVGVDPSNLVFATGAADNTVKIWDLATGNLKVTLDSLHTHAVRSVKFSSRHAYMFTAGEDKRVQCFDLEYNKVVRGYHGHVAAVWSMELHPTLDLLVTGARDSSVRVWDIRTRAQVVLLAGHKDAVSALQTQAVDPQIVSGSEDTTVRLWDLVAGRCSVTLTHHKKGVRALALHPTEFSFASGSTGSIKKFALPEGRLVHDFESPVGITNTLSLNRDGVLVGGSDDGELRFWDWGSAKPFQKLPIPLQAGSLRSEAACKASAFDVTGSRLITCNKDKSIHMYKEVEVA